MSFLKNIFKKGKGERLEKAIEKPRKKTIEKPVKVKAEKATGVKEKEKKQKSGKATNRAVNILSAPQITEKAAWLEEKNFYVFKVNDNANKNEIKKAVEEMYGVSVIKVNVVSIPRKAKRLQKSKGFKKGYKKAIVKLKQGQTIEILPR